MPPVVVPAGGVVVVLVGVVGVVTLVGGVVGVGGGGGDEGEMMLVTVSHNPVSGSMTGHVGERES